MEQSTIPTQWREWGGIYGRLGATITDAQIARLKPHESLISWRPAYLTAGASFATDLPPAA